MKVEEILQDQDCINIAKKASVSFSGVLSQDEIDYCITNAAWNSAKSYDQSKNAKLTTFLYKGVIIECTKQIKKNRGKNNDLLLGGLNDSYLTIESNLNHSESLEIIDEIKNCQDPDIMYGRFYENKTLKELAEEKSLTKEAIRLRIQKNLKIIKSRIDSGV